ncbi:molecular chaperone GrpE (heat shock protein) [Desulfosporosinus orientis DSM 765]|uniref:Protein GrpE n=1 Tax=Desulfosporosinus orientis (strain ATCC 19365 / DSM 765 / NCIMB 8382 / VKM B-1628 / Singapore I) TaxID=768706 RepID=G7WJG5_DESOD|nr:nucleotide exchange factor GrpE [Desulfosporosinus orientis]AET70402.1 molecular chaperone GrpE (heat shock protein) [Desulfosporosinus orientis DSM 765]
MARMGEETLRGRKLSKDENPIEENQEQDLDLENSPEKDNPNSKEMNPLERILTLEAELEQAKANVNEHQDHLMRLQAEFDNYRKRTQKEKTEIIKYASERLIAELLPVLDNFERAASSARTNPDFNAFSQGVDMIFRQMQTVLDKEGLKAIEATGQPFDPNLHDAVLRVESDEHPENTVVEELQKGYYLKEKVLRPSMVKVSN